MNKNFTLQNFKSASLNASDYLKGKGYDVPRSVMLNMFSVFLGSKNWNTLEAKLSENNISSKEINIENISDGLVLVISENEKAYMDYINKDIIPAIIKNKSKSALKILRYISDNELENYREDIFTEDAIPPNEQDNIYYSITHQNQYTDFRELMMTSLRRAPDVICISELNKNLTFDRNIFIAAVTGHLIILGLKAKNETDALNMLNDNIRIHSKQETHVDLKKVLKKVIDLNK